MPIRSMYVLKRRTKKMESRVASCSRVTKETQIEMTLNLDGTGKTDISTGIGFSTICFPALQDTDFFDLKLKVTGI